MTSDCRHHLSDDAFSPMGARRYLKCPCCMRNQFAGFVVQNQLKVTVYCVQFAEQFSIERYGLNDFPC